jgi:hypothetical protein
MFENLFSWATSGSDDRGAVRPRPRATPGGGGLAGAGYSPSAGGCQRRPPAAQPRDRARARPAAWAPATASRTAGLPLNAPRSEPCSTTTTAAAGACPDGMASSPLATHDRLAPRRRRQPRRLVGSAPATTTYRPGRHLSSGEASSGGASQPASRAARRERPRIH